MNKIGNIIEHLGSFSLAFLVMSPLFAILNNWVWIILIALFLNSVFLNIYLYIAITEINKNFRGQIENEY